jgi:hypothetical protein
MKLSRLPSFFKEQKGLHLKKEGNFDKFITYILFETFFVYIKMRELF